MRKITKKNYNILAVIAILVVILMFYIKSWVDTYREEKITKSPFQDTVEEVKLEELSTVLSEMNEVLIYIGHTNDSKLYKMEKNLLKYIKEQEIVDKFIYINITNNKNYIEELSSVFNKGETLINKSPLIIYVKNGEEIEVINNSDGVIYTYNIDNLIMKYNINK